MNRLVTAAALIGFLSVALGAFGAHALDGRLTDEGLEWWHTATLYGLTHAGVALAAGLATRGGKLVIGGWLIVVGAAIFAATAAGIYPSIDVAAAAMVRPAAEFAP